LEQKPFVAYLALLSRLLWRITIWSRTMYDDEINDQVANDIIDALRAWAQGHPARDQPFMAIMRIEDDGTFTPREFLNQVEQKTNFGRSFMRFVVAQAKKYDLQPAELVRRAVKANQFGPIAEDAP
jgi:hypothetical protein